MTEPPGAPAPAGVLFPELLEGYLRFLPREGRPPEVVPFARVTVRVTIEREPPFGPAALIPRSLPFLRPWDESTGMEGSNFLRFFLPIVPSYSSAKVASPPA